MTPENVRKAVQHIREIAGDDDEVAHSLEDDLYKDILTAISEGTCFDPQGCAFEALKTAEIEFARWCA